MGTKERIIDPEIRALTQLVSSFVQKRSSLNYQINQLKLAQNTKKTCIETKKLRDLKAKNATLVTEIKNSERILNKIKQKKIIPYKEKNLASNVQVFENLLRKKNKEYNENFSMLTEMCNELDNKKNIYLDQQKYLENLKNNHEKNKEMLIKNSEMLTNIENFMKDLSDLKQNHESALQNKQRLLEKHSKLAQRRKLKRKQTLVIPKLSQNAFMLRSKLLLKQELLKQLNELKADQTLHYEQQFKIRKSIELEQFENEDFKNLAQLVLNQEKLQGKISEYRSELEHFQNTPILTSNREHHDSLYTDYDCTSESARYQ